MSFQNAFFEFAVGTSSGLPASDLPEIVFSGRSNVGKSSMINKVLNRKSLARTSSAPGKTATINFYNIGFCRFADLPGYGYAKVSQAEKERWAELVEGYFAADRDIRLVVQIIDMRRAPTEDDMRMIEFMQAKDLPFLVAASKSDKLNVTQRKEQTAQLEELFTKRGIEYLPFSALNGEGAEQLQKSIQHFCKE